MSERRRYAIRGLGTRGGLALPLRDAVLLDVPIPPKKEKAPCCRARRDAVGRPPIGFCSPECIRRPENWAEHLRRRGRR